MKLRTIHLLTIAAALAACGRPAPRPPVSEPTPPATAAAVAPSVPATETPVETPILDLAPAPTPAVSLIAFKSLRDSQVEAYAMRDDGSEQTRLTFNYNPVDHLAWSPDGQALAYQRSAWDRDGFDDAEVYALDLRTGRQAQVSHNLGMDAMPTWAPDGERVAFVSEQDGQPDIAVAGRDGADAQRLIASQADLILSPSWSPDGTRLAFLQDSTQGLELFVAPADGGEPTRIAEYAAEGEPAWSPDGQTLAFASVRHDEDLPCYEDCNTELYLVEADGGNLTRLTDNPGADEAPAWSPDGTQIAFESSRGDNADIYVVDVASRGLTRLTDDPADDFAPSWSPDGRRIAFASGRDDNTDIYVANADGSGLQRLTDDPAADFDPQWSPATWDESPLPSFPQHRVDNPLAPAPLAVDNPDNLSAGDPYMPDRGNRGYDVQHYTLRLALDPGVTFVEGSATIQARSTQEDLTQVSLDLCGFEIAAVEVDGADAPFGRQACKLLVDLPAPAASGAGFTLTVAYAGQPGLEASEYVPFVSNLGLRYRSNNTVYALAEPNGAAGWFPANDHPRDKATFRIELTVPDGLTGVANGVLVDQAEDLANAFPDGRAGDRFVWEHALPMAPYLATVAVGPYVALEGTSPGGVPLRHYVYPELRDEFEALAPEIGSMVDWMAERLGPYPFETFGYVTVAEEGVSLETQTLVLLSTQMIDKQVMAHELAHMWFGDWVSLDSWQDMWRNEGLATYLSEMYLNKKYLSRFDALRDLRSPENPPVRVDFPLGDPPPADLFGWAVYDNGAGLAHALRREMGDEAFFAGLRSYFERYGGAAATQEQFRGAMEEACDCSLSKIMRRWLE